MIAVQAPSELRSIYRDNRLLPFIGAGISMSVSWEIDGKTARGPSWSQLVSEATALLGFSHPDLARVRGTDLQILEYFTLQNARSPAKLTNWFVTHMAPPESALRDSKIHAALARLRSCQYFYTTNYDDFLERSFKIHGRSPRVIVVEDDMGQSLSNAIDCEIVKFHGDWNHPETLVLSESNYEERFRFESPLDFRFRSDMLGRAALFLGYSFRDQNVSYLFRRLNDLFGDLPTSTNGRRGYITVADPSQFEIKLFAERKITVIPINGGHEGEDIAALLDQLEA